MHTSLVLTLFHYQEPTFFTGSVDAWVDDFECMTRSLEYVQLHKDHSDFLGSLDPKKDHYLPSPTYFVLLRDYH